MGTFSRGFAAIIPSGSEAVQRHGSEAPSAGPTWPSYPKRGKTRLHP